MKPLTRQYLINRGECCGNQCLNCPYDPPYTKNNTNLQADSTVVCFYTELSTQPSLTKQTKELLDYWGTSWYSHGWSPVILQEDYIINEPLYKQLKFNNFQNSFLERHSKHKLEYIRSCYMRWLAYHKYAQLNQEVFWADCDVINYGYKPHHKPKPNQRLARCSCAGIINKDYSSHIIKTFADLQNEKHDFNHLSKNILKEDYICDMQILMKMLEIDTNQICRNPFPLRQKIPPLIHYHGGILHKEFKGQKLTRLQAIKFVESLY